MATPKREETVTGIFHEVRSFIANVILFNQSVADSVGLNLTDSQCLHLLLLHGPARPGDLAQWTRLSSGGVTVALDRLERAGYIRREPNPADRRSTLIRPVPEQIQKLEPFYRSKTEDLARVLDGFTDRDLGVVLQFFRRANQPPPDSGT